MRRRVEWFCEISEEFGVDYSSSGPDIELLQRLDMECTDNLLHVDQ